MKRTKIIKGLGLNIRANLDLFGITEAELALRIGTSQNNVSFWINEKRNPTRHFISLMAKEFNCSKEYLLGYYD